jgi:hypothetical protein
MNALEKRWQALLRAYGLLIDLATISEEEAEVTAPAPADEQCIRVVEYAARVAALRPLHPGQRLTRRDREELADTDPDAPDVAKPTRRAGRKPLAARTDRPFSDRLNRDCREAAERLAKRYGGGVVPVPAVVKEQFRSEPDIAKKWAAHVRRLAGRCRG